MKRDLKLTISLEKWVREWWNWGMEKTRAIFYYQSGWRWEFFVCFIFFGDEKIHYSMLNGCSLEILVNWVDYYEKLDFKNFLKIVFDFLFLKT